MDSLNEANIQKLLYELDVLKMQLQPDQTETINKVTTIMASIATIAQAFGNVE
jgi:predicted lipoprotein